MQRKLMIYVASLAFELCGIAFLALGTYEGLAAVMPSAFAALTTGAGLLVLALALVRFVSARGRAESPARCTHRGLDSAERALRERADALLSAGIRRYPAGATLTTLLLGVVAGWFSESRDRGRADRR